MSKGKRGFASMSVVRRTAIAKAGGIAAHKQGKAHTWTSEEASKAGSIGGSARKGKQYKS